MADDPDFTVYEPSPRHRFDGAWGNEPPPDDPEDPGWTPPPGFDDGGRGGGRGGRTEPPQDEKAYVPLKVIDPREWAGKPIPVRQWLIPDWMPAEGEVTGCWAAGGDGKTILSQQLQVACATETPWLGLQVEPCCSFGIYCEDNPDELHRRFNAITADLGIGFAQLGNMRCASAVGEDNALVRFDREGGFTVTARFEDLVANAIGLKAKLLVVDTAADTFGDGNENDRSHVRNFVGGVLRSAAMELNGAVLLNAHPSVRGINTGTVESGSTGWSNTVRSRWGLTRPPKHEDVEPDPDVRLLTRMKANYASVGEIIELRWRNGILVPQHRPDGGTSMDRLARQLHIEQLFMTIFDRLTEARVKLSESTKAGNFAPKKMAQQPEAGGTTVAEFTRAMNNLMANRVIVNESYGRRGDARMCLVRNPDSHPDQEGKNDD